MRMWMVNPAIMCNKHLGGEHVECHMFVGAINKGKSIEGHAFLNQTEIRNLTARHEALANEMLARGMQHNSELPEFDITKLPRFVQLTKVNKKAALEDLLHRCPNCRARHENYTKN